MAAANVLEEAVKRLEAVASRVEAEEQEMVEELRLILKTRGAALVAQPVLERARKELEHLLGSLVVLGAHLLPGQIRGARFLAPCVFKKDK